MRYSNPHSHLVVAGKQADFNQLQEQPLPIRSRATTNYAKSSTTYYRAPRIHLRDSKMEMKGERLFYSPVHALAYAPPFKISTTGSFGTPTENA